jgi:hypothetical protein
VSRKINKIGFIIIRSLVATICCVVIGLVFYRQQVWNIYYPAFRFVTYGVVGSLFFCSLLELGLRNAIAILVLLFFIEAEFILGSFEYGRLLNDIIYFTIAPLAVLVFYKVFHSKVQATTFFDPLILGGLFAGASTLARFVLDIHRQTQVQYWAILRPWQLVPDLAMSFLIGFGLGLGFFLTERRRGNESHSGVP